MKNLILNEEGLKNRREWEDKGYNLPEYDRLEMIKKTKEQPFWIHFGAGNIFRAFQANVVQNLLNQGKIQKGLVAIQRGLVVAEGYDYELVEKMNDPHDGYSILVTLKADGTIEKTVVGSVAEALVLDSENEKQICRLEEIFQKDSLQMASFTITEKGYSLVDGRGKVLPEVAADFATGPKRPRSYMGKVAALLYTRYLRGARPIAMVSMDNVSHNGDKLFGVMKNFAEEWTKRGLVKPGFLTYVKDKNKVSFPWTMIDKITPRPDATIEKILMEDGLEGVKPITTSKGSFVAPFVNAEECEYLVIEDAFPNGREPLEAGGIIFTDRETVDKVEKMKVCTCLNPLHTTLAIFGCLLGYKKISDEMQDEQLRKLVEKIGYFEGLPVVVNPGILDPKEFIDTVLKVRIPNPFMPDTPQRIATDTSQKLAIRFGETIKAYQASATLDTDTLVGIPLVLAGWIRYLMGVDDEGNTFFLSPDPLLEVICPFVEGNSLDAQCNVHKHLKNLLSEVSIFGVNLYEAGLGERVEKYFEELIAGPGAVRKTLMKYTS